MSSGLRLVYAERLDRGTPFAWLDGERLDADAQHRVHEELARVRRGRHRAVNGPWGRAVRSGGTTVVTTRTGLRDADGVPQTVVIVVEGVDSATTVDQLGALLAEHADVEVRAARLREALQEADDAFLTRRHRLLGRLRAVTGRDRAIRDPELEELA